MGFDLSSIKRFFSGVGDTMAKGYAAQSSATTALYRGVNPNGTVAKSTKEMLVQNGLPLPKAEDPPPITVLNYSTDQNYTGGMGLKFPLTIDDYEVPYVCFKVYESQIGPAQERDKNDTAVSLSQGLGTIAEGFNEWSTLIGSAAGAVAAGAATASAGAAVAGAAVGSVLGVSAAVASNSFFRTPIGQQAKAGLTNLAFQRNLTALKGAIFLAMPEGIQVSYSQAYEAISVTNATGKSGGILQAAAEFNNSAEGTRSSKMNPYLMEAAGSALETALGGAGLAKLTFFGSTGLAVNPQMEMIYTAPDLRTFRFDFRLVPKNADESKAIAEIIKAFKVYSSPKFQASVTSVGRYFIPPCQFEIEFYDSEHKKYATDLPYLYKTKKCVLKDISIDYSGSGAFATFADGAPVETRVQLEFQETTILSQDDVIKGY